MVCVRMFEPSPETVIGLTINIAVETFTGTAGEYYITQCLFNTKLNNSTTTPKLMVQGI